MGKIRRERTGHAHLASTYSRETDRVPPRKFSLSSIYKRTVLLQNLKYQSKRIDWSSKLRLNFAAMLFVKQANKPSAELQQNLKRRYVNLIQNQRISSVM